LFPNRDIGMEAMRLAIVDPVISIEEPFATNTYALIFCEGGNATTHAARN
jgi:hypothetical protein